MLFETVKEELQKLIKPIPYDCGRGCTHKECQEIRIFNKPIYNVLRKLEEAEEHLLDLLKKSFDNCVTWVPMKVELLKNTHTFNTFETLCEVFKVDSCWFYQYFTGRMSNCNPDTKKKFQELFNKLKSVK